MNWKDTLTPLWDTATVSNEQIWLGIREWRNRQLAACDWTQLPDIDPRSLDVAAWRVYRQELRDMMDQSTDPKQIVFPTPPV